MGPSLNTGEFSIPEPILGPQPGGGDLVVRDMFFGGDQNFAAPNGNVTVDGPTWELEQDVDLRPAQVMVASFKDGFRLQ